MATNEKLQNYESETNKVEKRGVHNIFGVKRGQFFFGSEKGAIIFFDF